jgi:hypothetical protein
MNHKNGWKVCQKLFTKHRIPNILSQKKLQVFQRCKFQPIVHIVGKTLDPRHLNLHNTYKIILKISLWRRIYVHKTLFTIKDHKNEFQYQHYIHTKSWIRALLIVRPRVGTFAFFLNINEKLGFNFLIGLGVNFRSKN